MRHVIRPAGLGSLVQRHRALSWAALSWTTRGSGRRYPWAKRRLRMPELLEGRLLLVGNVNVNLGDLPDATADEVSTVDDVFQEIGLSPAPITFRLI